MNFATDIAMKLINFHLTTLIIIVLKTESLDCIKLHMSALREELSLAYKDQIIDTQETYTNEECRPADKEMNLTQKADFYNRNLVKQLTEQIDYRNPGDNVLKYIVNYNQQLKKITKLYEIDKNLALKAVKDVLRIGKPTFLNVSVSEKGLNVKFNWNIQDLIVLSELRNQTLELWKTCMSYIKH